MRVDAESPGLPKARAAWRPALSRKGGRRAPKGGATRAGATGRHTIASTMTLSFHDRFRTDVRMGTRSPCGSKTSAHSRTCSSPGAGKASSDLEAYLRAAPERMQQCADSLRLLQGEPARRWTLFAATSQQELQDAAGRSLPRRHARAHAARDAGAVAGPAGLREPDRQLRARRAPHRCADPACACCRATRRVGTACWSRCRTSRRPCSRAPAAGQPASSHARDLFHYSPVSLWVEDFSGVKRLLDEVRMQGIQDFPRVPERAPRVRPAAAWRRSACSR